MIVNKIPVQNDKYILEADPEELRKLKMKNKLFEMEQ